MARRGHRQTALPHPIRPQVPPLPPAGADVGCPGGPPGRCGARRQGGRHQAARARASLSRVGLPGGSMEREDGLQEGGLENRGSQGVGKAAWRAAKSGNRPTPKRPRHQPSVKQTLSVDLFCAGRRDVRIRPLSPHRGRHGRLRPGRVAGGGARQLGAVADECVGAGRWRRAARARARARGVRPPARRPGVAGAGGGGRFPGRARHRGRAWGPGAGRAVA